MFLFESKNSLVLGHKFWMLFDRKDILQQDIEYCRMQKSLKLISHLNSNRTSEPIGYLTKSQENEYKFVKYMKHIVA